VEVATPLAWILFFGILGVLTLMIITAQRGRKLFLRRIPGMDAIDEATGRATELGRAMLVTFGLVNIPDYGVIAMQAMLVLSHIARLAARFGNRLLVPCADVPVYAMSDQIVREAYRAEGKEEAYRADDVRFLSDRQFAYAAGTVGMMNRERVGSTFYFGYFFAESLLLAEEGQHIGAMQIAGTPATTQIPFFIAATDYVIIGDEYYAASAYLSKEPTLLGSLVGQDISKAVFVAFIVVGIVWTLITSVQSLVSHSAAQGMLVDLLAAFRKQLGSGI